MMVGLHNNIATSFTITTWYIISQVILTTAINTSIKVIKSFPTTIHNKHSFGSSEQWDIKPATHNPITLPGIPGVPYAAVKKTYVPDTKNNGWSYLHFFHQSTSPTACTIIIDSREYFSVTLSNIPVDNTIVIYVPTTSIDELFGFTLLLPTKTNRIRLTDCKSSTSVIHLTKWWFTLYHSFLTTSNDDTIESIINISHKISLAKNPRRKLYLLPSAWLID